MKIDRLLALLLILFTRDRVTASELAETFEVSVRTIYRDMETLAQAGIPVFAEQGKGGGLSLMEGYRLERRFFSADELGEVLSVVRGLPEITGDEVMDRAVEKIARLTGGGEEPLADYDLTGSLSGEEREIMARLAGEIRAQKTLVLTYRTGEGNRSEREIEPLRLTFHNRNWYLQAWCRKRGDYRLFKIARIEAVSPGGTPFDRKSRLAGLPPLLLEGKEEPVEMDLLFSPPAKERAEEFFRGADWIEDPRGFRLLLAWPLDEGVYSFLLGYGPGLTVLGPDFLRREVAERHRRAWENYGDSTE